MKSKIWIIAQREYTQRIRTKGFILITLLGPLALVALVGIPLAVEIFFDDDDARTIAVVDQTAAIRPVLTLPAGIEVAEVVPDLPLDSLSARVQRGTYDGFLLLPKGLLRGEGEPQYYSKGGGGFAFRLELERSIGNAIRAERIRRAGATEEVMDLLQARTSLHMVRLTDDGAETDATAFMSGVGYFMGFLIYICMFLYGTLVMRGVIEEKTNRILEVVASSARPFQLMMGKVLGIGALGMTQFIAWIVLSLAVLTLVGALLDPAAIPLSEQAAQDAGMAAVGLGLPTIPIALFVYFLLFFLGGYLLYASLFAAVGSAVEQESDAQQFFLPISLPIILAIIFMMRILSRPDGVFSIVASIFPLFSPILMPARAAVTPVPFWQVALALVLLGLAFLGTVWLSARIYRVGILMYGKKPTFKDLVKWVRYA